MLSSEPVGGRSWATEMPCISFYCTSHHMGLTNDVLAQNN